MKGLTLQDKPQQEHPENCLFCGKPVKRKNGRTCGSHECRQANRQLRNTMRGTIKYGPLNKCQMCDKPTSTIIAKTCGSEECRRVSKALINRKRHRKQQKALGPMPPCKYCGQPVKKRFHKTCGSKSCRAQYKAELQRLKHYRESKAGPSVTEIREYYGLKPIKSGKIACKRCGKTFHSQDTDRRRHCQDCRNIMAKFTEGAIRSAVVYGKFSRAVSAG